MFWSHWGCIVNDAEAKANKQKPESCVGRSEHGLEEAISVLKVLLRLGYSTMQHRAQIISRQPNVKFPMFINTVVILAILSMPCVKVCYVHCSGVRA